MRWIERIPTYLYTFLCREDQGIPDMCTYIPFLDNENSTPFQGFHPILTTMRCHLSIIATEHKQRNVLT